MVGNNKILTVSYGTFSCTLEGFDDPFGTMRGIAEYFRDLAADDRYFGAEPPTPDAEMLHRIAEKEVRRRVESRVEGNGVVLRPAPEEPVGTDAPIDESEPEETAASGLDYAPVAAAAAAAVPALRATGEDGIAEKLRRIRAAVAREPEEPPVLDTTPAPSAPAAAVEEPAPLPEPEPEPEPDVAPQGAQTAPDEHDYRGDDAALAAIEQALETPAENEGAPKPAALAEADTDEDEDDWMSFDLPEVEAADTPAPDTLDTGADTAREPAGAPEPVIEAGDADTADQNHDLIEEDFDVDTVFGGAPATEPLRLTPAQAAPEADAAAEARAEPGGPVRARVVKMRRDEFEATFEPQDDDAGDSVDVAAPALEDRVRAELGDTGLSPEDEDDLIAELAAAELDTEETATLPTVDDTAQPAPAAAAPATPAPEPEAPAAAAGAEPAAPSRPRRIMPDSDASIDRIMRQTDTELDSHDGNRRRSAIAHLKAAVAAVRADSSARAASRTDEMDTGQYREDLARVVRPERPSGRGAETPPARRMPPLMLVSEQRVDGEGRTETELRVQPRRVQRARVILRDDDPAEPPELPDEDTLDANIMAGPDTFDNAPETDADTGGTRNIFSAERDFSAFLDRHEITGLEDLLEASAAYGAFVEGADEATRADIIQRVRDAMPEAIASREDALRAFGTILRDGRLLRLRRGVFTVAEDTRFRPRRTSATG